MKKILYLTFYFEPDLCAGSFRNTPLAKELAKQLGVAGEVVVVTTMPNRYSTYKVDAPAYEVEGNLKIHRITIPPHRSGFSDQINSFRAYYNGVHRLMKNEQFDLVFASSSRLFTAYLGHLFASRLKVPLYLDIRDIFVDTINDVLQNFIIRTGAIPILNYIERRTFSHSTHINLISGGFNSYFTKYPKPNYSNFSNGIDDVFLNLPPTEQGTKKNIKTITYAGNIGEGQGLHKIIPQAAKILGGGYQFNIIGDGGAKGKLEEEIQKLFINNVLVSEPVQRSELLKIYHQSDFLFIHLNDFDAFKKVLPSKVFELGAYDKPIIAGVGGFAYQFIQDNIPNSLLFHPGDVQALLTLMQEYQYVNFVRSRFLADFKRSSINEKMSSSILSYLA